jgi:hypothetical protein
MAPSTPTVTGEALSSKVGAGEPAGGGLEVMVGAALATAAEDASGAAAGLGAGGVGGSALKSKSGVGLVGTGVLLPQAMATRASEAIEA